MAKSMRFYNTLTRTKEIFIPQDPKRITVYQCGPTVYAGLHVGNARALVVFDVLFRLLRHTFPDVIFVRNLTDIDDKIIERAQALGQSIDHFTQATTQLCHEQMRALGTLPPTHEPKATDYIPEMIHMIQTLLIKKAAYPDEKGHVFFRARAYPSYGSLAGKTLDHLQSGARIQPGESKEDPLDFVLWKPSSNAQPGWESPWGRGRPGWHIECSAMAGTLLGPTIDFHLGGQDLIFPHHENEIAQSCCAHDTPLLARFWIHNAMVEIDGKKMSKSIGNLVDLGALLEMVPAPVLRLILLSTHYRHPLQWTEQTLQQAQAVYAKWSHALEGFEAPEEQAFQTASQEPEIHPFFEALEDDLNTPEAFQHLHMWTKHIHQEKSLATKQKWQRALWLALRFLNLDPPIQQMSDATHDPWVQTQLSLREKAREQKNYAESDRLRNLLLKAGYQVQDGTSGQQTVKKMV